jgi:hypothetical protein
MNTVYIQPDQADAISTIMSNSNCGLALALSIFNNKVRDEREKLNKIKQLDIRHMSKKEVIAATWSLPELSKDMYELLSEQGGFKTGSSVFTDINSPNDEDWCVCMPPSVFSEYTIGQCDEGYWHADGFSAIYAHHNGMLINIICFSDARLFEAWFATTEAMKKMAEWPTLATPYNWSNNNQINLAELFKTKWKRVILFRALKDICYEPHMKRPMEQDAALKYSKCKECSREAIYFTCAAAKAHYEATVVCERCAGITY